MKKGLGFLMLSFATAGLFVACDDSSTKANAQATTVHTEADLEACSNELQGESVLVLSTGLYYTCDNGEWTRSASSGGALNTETDDDAQPDELSDVELSSGSSVNSDSTPSTVRPSSSAGGAQDAAQTSSATETGSSSSSEQAAVTSATSVASATEALKEYESSQPFIDEGWRDECLRLANEYRATEGVAPLELADDEKQICAINQAASDMADNKAHGHFGDCDEWAQNSGPNFSTSWRTNATGAVQYYIKMMWEDEKALVTSGQRDPDKKEDYPDIGHYLNMRKASYTKVACGIAISEDGTKGWFNMNFY